MGKVKPEGPDHLTMDLFAPGMSLLHRAGLGGLACTLKAMERQYGEGMLPESKLPAPLDGDEPPWEIDHQSITLHFGKATSAASYLEKLFSFAFPVRKDGLIALAGQYATPPSAAVLADLQAGLTLTFLQHGKVRKLEKKPTAATYLPEGDEGPSLVVDYRKCSWFKHQDAWKELVDKEGRLTIKSCGLEGPVCPGAVVRHVAYTGKTGAEDPPGRLLPLLFALIGCLPIPVNRGVAALLVPEVENLVEFAVDRPFLSPTTPEECRIASAADGALQAQVRLRSKRSLDTAGIPGCYAMTFSPTPWAIQQKSRVATIHVPPGEETTLDRFERALAALPPRVLVRTIKEKFGKGSERGIHERTEAFRTDSVVRPLIAENLALGRKWYAGFVGLMVKNNPATGKPFRNQLRHERKGLHAMIADNTMWDEEGEKLVVEAVHEAIRRSFGRIRTDTDGETGAPPSQATKNRWERFREKLRLDLAGAKTDGHVRFALMDLFTRGRINSVLQEAWQKVLPVLRSDWQLARDLSLLALASYAGRGVSEIENENEQPTA